MPPCLSQLPIHVDTNRDRDHDHGINCAEADSHKKHLKASREPLKRSKRITQNTHTHTQNLIRSYHHQRRTNTITNMHKHHTNDTRSHQTCAPIDSHAHEHDISARDADDFVPWKCTWCQHTVFPHGFVRFSPDILDTHNWKASARVRTAHVLRMCPNETERTSLRAIRNRWHRRIKKEPTQRERMCVFCTLRCTLANIVPVHTSRTSTTSTTSSSSEHCPCVSVWKSIRYTNPCV